MRAQRRADLVLPVPLDVLHGMRAQRRGTVGEREWRDVLHRRLATRQEGVVGRDQIVTLGFDRGAIARRLKTGALIQRHRWVYAVGHEAISFRGQAIAALLAVGDDAALSHETVAHLRALLPTQPPRIDVTIPGRRPRSREGVRVHAGEVETARHDGLLMTTPQRVIAETDG
jgi:hypothetical protein